jgi:hypothetical protein
MMVEPALLRQLGITLPFGMAGGTNDAYKLFYGTQLRCPRHVPPRLNAESQGTESQIDRLP